MIMSLEDDQPKKKKRNKTKQNKRKKKRKKKHTNLSYKATKRMERTFLNLLLLLASRNMR